MRPQAALKRAVEYELAGTRARAEDLRAWMDDAHAHTLASVEGLSEAQLRNPKLPIVNPFLWMVGHVGWFWELWVLRRMQGRAASWPEADGIYDSIGIPWDVRWDLPLPDKAGTLAYLNRVREMILGELAGHSDGAGRLDERATYFHRLGVYHEDMHREANTYFRQTHAFPAPPPVNGGRLTAPQAGARPGDVEVPGCEAYLLGATLDIPFVFDNEKWAHPVKVAPFRIARAPVTNAEFLEFVEAGGYDERHWGYSGKRWLAETGLKHPDCWRREANGRWLRRHFDQWVPLEPHHPVIHVSWYEADAFCHWAGRRLPTEAEWELAASAAPDGQGGVAPGKRRYPWGESAPTPAQANLDGWYGGCVDVGALPAGDSAWGCRQMLGNVWEWTADAFYPYPGFVTDPYRDYSAPWFGDHTAMRGGAWVTAPRQIRNSFRNYFRPRRNDTPTGFRTCAVAPGAAIHAAMPLA
jgi:iron(II)-dependent oxidoreductase